jgi:hypothetical protein
MVIIKYIREGYRLDLLNEALELNKKPQIINSDQGVQYTPDAWIDRVETNGIKMSMDDLGRWANNIYIELSGGPLNTNMFYSMALKL